MVLFSPKINKSQILWTKWISGRILELRARWAGARIAIAIYQHVWSSTKTQQDNRSDRAHVLSTLAHRAEH